MNGSEFRKEKGQLKKVETEMEIPTHCFKPFKALCSIYFVDPFNKRITNSRLVASILFMICCHAAICMYLYETFAKA